ncbi:MAG: 1,2-phenylacetyl-CoA epoxidase subunit PaaC [Enterobacterales bacterium]|nr:1,2-phenylacetyl-CoA epoxidase subunit PaaC [Enterobacterales bacterium]
MSNKSNNLYRFLVAQGDDAIILSHRLSEWCSNAPYLEEDLALTNVALDYLGRARLFYQYAAELKGGDETEDSIAYTRDERQYTNLLIHELPINDFAYTLLRQYFLDVFYVEYMTGLCQSSDQRIAAIAGKSVKESRYHLKRSQPWITQLAEGTEESRRRILDALTELESFVGELFEMPEWEQQLVTDGIAFDRQLIREKWDHQVQALLSASDINILDSQLKIGGGREGIHTEFLGHLLSEMQYLQRAYPGLKW